MAGQHEKTGYEHWTPVTDKAVATMQEVWRMSPGTGDGPVLPGADPSKGISRVAVQQW